MNKACFVSPNESKSISSVSVSLCTDSRSNVCNRVAQEIRIDLSVFPETKSQGLFHQIHKEVTFCGLPHGAYA